jgi:hypothetical protein
MAASTCVGALWTDPRQHSTNPPCAAPPYMTIRSGNATALALLRGHGPCPVTCGCSHLFCLRSNTPSSPSPSRGVRLPLLLPSSVVAAARPAPRPPEGWQGNNLLLLTAARRVYMIHCKMDAATHVLHKAPYHVPVWGVQPALGWWACSLN